MAEQHISAVQGTTDDEPVDYQEEYYEDVPAETAEDAQVEEAQAEAQECLPEVAEEAKNETVSSSAPTGSKFEKTRGFLIVT